MAEAEAVFLLLVPAAVVEIAVRQVQEAGTVMLQQEQLLTEQEQLLEIMPTLIYARDAQQVALLKPTELMALLKSLPCFRQ